MTKAQVPTSVLAVKRTKKTKLLKTFCRNQVWMNIHEWSEYQVVVPTTTVWLSETVLLCMCCDGRGAARLLLYAFVWVENWPFLREGQLNKDGGWKQKQTNCSSEYSWEVEWLRAIQITRNRREGIVPLIPVRLSFILEQYCATCSVLDYIAECFEAESLKEVSLAAAAHFDRQTLIRVEKFSGLKKTLNNFNVQTKLWVVPVEQF